VVVRVAANAGCLREHPLAAREGELDVELARRVGTKAEGENAVGIAGDIFTAVVVSW
jgi:hypothetical protein